MMKTYRSQSDLRRIIYDFQDSFWHWVESIRVWSAV